jgi:hypothetical protein
MKILKSRSVPHDGNIIWRGGEQIILCDPHDADIILREPKCGLLAHLGGGGAKGGEGVGI